MKVENHRYTLSSSEMRSTLVTSFLAAVLLNAFTMVVLSRFLGAPPPLVTALSFFVFGLPMFLPLRFVQARRNVHLTWGKFLLACGGGAVIAGVVRVLLDTVVWP